jgi:hypothetical protein
VALRPTLSDGLPFSGKDLASSLSGNKARSIPLRVCRANAPLPQALQVAPAERGARRGRASLPEADKNAEYFWRHPQPHKGKSPAKCAQAPSSELGETATDQWHGKLERTTATRQSRRPREGHLMRVEKIVGGTAGRPSLVSKDDAVSTLDCGDSVSGMERDVLTEGGR